MSAPVVTVLLAVRDAAQHIDAVVENILSQAFADLELLVVDDGSADTTRARLKGVRDARVRVLEQPRLGLTAALSRGVSEARGEFVARQDADDRSHPDRLAKQVALLRARPEVALVGTGVRVVDSSRRLLGDYVYPTAHKAIMRALFDLSNPLPHTSIMFRRREVAACGGYRGRFLKSQEYDLFLRVGERHQLATIADPLCELEHSMTSMTGAAADGEQFEYGVLGLVAAVIRRNGWPDPLDAPDGDRFHQRYREWYRTSELPAAFRSRLLRRAARLSWAEARPFAALRHAARSVIVDPWWARDELVPWATPRAALVATRWATAHRPMPHGRG